MTRVAISIANISQSYSRIPRHMAWRGLIVFCVGAWGVVIFAWTQL